MSSFAERNLINGENIIYKARISKWPFTFLYFLGGLLLPLCGSRVLIFLVVYLAVKSREVVITNKRVISKSGFISRKTVEISIKKIEGIQIHQGVVGRMLNFGSLVLSGAGSPLEKTPAISDPLQFRKVFLETQEEIEKSTTKELPLKNFKAKIRLSGQSTTDAEIQGYTADNAKALLEAKYGKGAVISDLAQSA